MVSSFWFFITALAQNAGASRFHPLVAMEGLAPNLSGYSINASGNTHDGLMPFYRMDGLTPTNRFWQRIYRMELERELRHKLANDHNASEVWHPDIPDNWHVFPEWNLLQPSIVPFSQQAFPPTMLYTIDMRRLLQKWEQRQVLLAESGPRKDNTFIEGIRTTYLTEEQALGTIWQDKATVLQKMVDAFGIKRRLVQIGHLEAVGLLPRGDCVDCVGLDRQTLRAVAGHQLDRRSLGQRLLLAALPLQQEERQVQALAVFSREELEDKSKGSLLKMVGVQYGIKATLGVLGRCKTCVSVFAIQGIAEAPSLPLQSARDLLAKIAKWAEIEQKLVVVARDAVHLSDGTDLTAYYMRLGFAKLESDDGSYDLVYAGTSASHTDQLMVGLNL